MSFFSGSWPVAGDTDYVTKTAAVIGETDAGLADHETRVTAAEASVARLDNRAYGIAILGDSHAGGAGDATSIRFFDLFCGYTGQRARYRGNKGVGGQTSAQIAARLTDITGMVPKPSWCMVCAGFNDIGADTAVATIMTNIATIATGLRAAGVEPILCQIPPANGWSGSQRVAGLRLNAAIQEYAYQHGHPVADLYTPVANPTTGGYLAAMTIDNTHMSYKGARTVAKAVADALLNLFPPGGVYLCGRGYWDTDISRIYNGNFLGDTNADGLADAWAKSTSGGTVTYSLEADGSTGRNWQRMAVTVAPTSASFNRDFQAGDWAVGDVIQVACRVRTASVESGSGRFYIRLDLTGGSPTTDYLWNQWGYDIDTEVTLAKRIVVPTGTTSVSFRVGWISGTGTIDIAQPTAINLTALGLV